MRAGLVLLSHGSRRGKSVDDFLYRLAEKAAFLLPKDLKLAVAHLQFSRPDFLEAVEELVKEGYRRILVFPLFLLPGRHPCEDVPALVREASGKHADVEVELCPSLGEQPWFFEVVARWVLDALPADLKVPTAYRVAMSGPEITEMSLTFVEGLIREANAHPKGGDGLWEITTRIVHATGDPSLAASLRITPDALERGLTALLAKKPLIVDVEMVKAGVNRHLLNRLGCPLICAVETAGHAPANTTRTSWGIKRLAPRLEGALVAVGNAPTALISLLETVQEGMAAPSLVIGMPVGFVQAVVAKDLLKSSGIPFITLEGTKGGSSAAVATINCLLDMAARRLMEGSERSSGHPSATPSENGG